MTDDRCRCGSDLAHNTDLEESSATPTEVREVEQELRVLLHEVTNPDTEDERLPELRLRIKQLEDRKWELIEQYVRVWLTKSDRQV